LSKCATQGTMIKEPGAGLIKKIMLMRSLKKQEPLLLLSQNKILH